jgi:hypothetical protein
MANLAPDESASDFRLDILLQRVYLRLLFEISLCTIENEIFIIFRDHAESPDLKTMILSQLDKLKDLIEFPSLPKILAVHEINCLEDIQYRLQLILSESRSPSSWSIWRKNRGSILDYPIFPENVV